jgi:hypothetical protein
MHEVHCGINKTLFRYMCERVYPLAGFCFGPSCPVIKPETTEIEVKLVALCIQFNIVTGMEIWGCQCSCAYHG